MGRTDERPLSERHIRATHEVLIALPNSSYEDTVARISALEEADRRFFRHTRSLWIARCDTLDLRLTSARFYGRPLNECEALLAQRIALGFVDLYDEVLYVGAHALYCGEMARPDLARHYLRDLVEKVDDACARGEPFDSACAASLRRNLAELES